MEELTKAKKRALYLLTDMDRTEKELSDKLKKTGYSDETIARTMEYVRSFGYIDDRKYAEKYIDSARHKKSRMRIVFDLTNKGVSRDVIDDALMSVGEWDERDLIRNFAEKKMKKMDRADPKTYTKTASYLAGKGFSGTDIMAVLRDLKDSLEDSTEPYE